MKIYEGSREKALLGLTEIKVTVNDQPLKHRVRHSPTSFEWGYLGSGPADLALSILWNFMGHEPTRADYMCFKDQFVAKWGNEWQVTGEEIQNWLNAFAEAKERS